MGKRIAAIAGLTALGLLYLATMFSAFFAGPGTHQLFLASLVGTIFIPVLIWLFIQMYEAKHHGGGMTMREMRKLNKRLKNGESAEALAKEIEEKYAEEKSKKKIKMK